MLTLLQCKAVLNRNGNQYSDEDILAIRDYLYEMAQIDYDVYMQSRSENIPLKKAGEEDEPPDIKNAA